MESSQASLLYKILQARQAQYATSCAQDVQLLSEMQTSTVLEGSALRLKMALQVRIGEKEILQTLLAMLESLVANGSLKRAADGDNHDSRQSKTPRV